MKTLWVLEDHTSLRNSLQRVFAKDPAIRCTYAFGNGAAMLRELNNGTAPDILLIDIGLPDISGLDVISKVRALAPTTVIIVLTVYEDDEKIFKAVCAGAAGYLLKGSSVTDIIQTVKDALSGGSPMSPTIARRVLEMFSRMAPKIPDYGLTPREHEILQHVVSGLTTKELAEKIGLSIHTVDTHLRRIYSKLEVHNRSGAVAKALRENLA
ncbi:MAG: response regulator transcription factor [Verrucomicrobiota bacterium]